MTKYSYADKAEWQKKLADIWDKRKEKNGYPSPRRPWRVDPWPSEPDYGDNPFGPEAEPAPAQKPKRKRKKVTKPKEQKPKTEPSRITPGIPKRDLIFD